MGRQNLRGGFPLGALLLALLLAGCTHKPQPAPRPAPRPQPAAAALPLRRLGYTIQAGAFAQVENAARLAEVLQGKGLNAVYYAATAELYRVRFGDFPTRAAAKARAEALVAAGTIQTFYLVAPDEPALTRVHPKDASSLRVNLVATGDSYLGVPYLWGGSTAKGFDCSGLAMAVYRLNGLQLPRSAREQYEAGSPVTLERVRAGDLLFFATDGSGAASHVGIYVGEETFIHAPSRGKRISRSLLTDPYYRERFLGARNYL